MTMSMWSPPSRIPHPKTENQYRNPKLMRSIVGKVRNPGMEAAVPKWRYQNGGNVLRIAPPCCHQLQAVNRSCAAILVMLELVECQNGLRLTQHIAQSLLHSWYSCYPSFKNVVAKIAIGIMEFPLQQAQAERYPSALERCSLTTWSISSAMDPCCM